VQLGKSKRVGYLLARECVTCLDTEVDRLGRELKDVQENGLLAGRRMCQHLIEKKRKRKTQSWVVVWAY
jgi:hypothetical protein